MMVFIVAVIALLASCRAQAPGGAEAALVKEIKKETIGGKDWKNPLPDTPENQRTGAEHFQHHCQICHGLDGHNTGVPFADAMSPPVADLGDKSVQAYSDGQLKWIIQNGIRFTGMPGWSGVLDDNEQWAAISYIRHLPAKGSLGPPPVYQEAEDKHTHAEEGQGSQPHQHKHPHGGQEHKH
ncbi:MAG: cytochrome c [Acidobacteriia bacterium]|nr:cytochrome c [Terriglobia bacterium]